mmetsp:Transcript_23129/g.39136  ORF Transcript_23129/g.39136 Transcript_23129/m.39136 type:complete len:164 (+) Transcript_23129:174-665(+)|eukprot:CAMPEP_0114433536 /NCGR_PEP_ID=MMETSP0103-20121206/11745_1 /TAXON_ID=37642 ORGANISM="Paraphysomonas imperforata, Strain PA2" /NCGR_SAMPLE_ID=MMETSP0103 /ASSEMBLY_ACC=CAM_ASM_000201 /LENGTH=163 /DNA_ID=CAMNT_0001603293 /DNA_START=151 /DNA_END=642 /DNA_ORIENTATION=+
MNAVVNQMNVFLRVFTTINRLFCEVRWLERNLRNSNSTVMFIVGGIIMFCLYSASVDGSGQSVLPPGMSQVIKDWGPFAIIAVVLGLFLYRRAANGPMDGSGNLNEVMFGDNRGRGSEREGAQSLPPTDPARHSSAPSNYPTAVATAAGPGPKYINAQAVQYV